jgi:hypothetical protein
MKALILIALAYGVPICIGAVAGEIFQSPRAASAGSIIPFSVIGWIVETSEESK